MCILIIVINVCGYLRVRYPRLVKVYFDSVIDVCGYLRVRYPRLACVYTYYCFYLIFTVSLCLVT